MFSLSTQTSAPCYSQSVQAKRAIPRANPSGLTMMVIPQLGLDPTPVQARDAFCVARPFCASLGRPIASTRFTPTTPPDEKKTPHDSTTTANFPTRYAYWTATRFLHDASPRSKVPPR